MTTLTLINRGMATVTSALPNNRRSVSDMSEEQRKAVMARLGGGGGAAGGYTGGARGGRRGPARKPTPMYVTPEGHARAVREAQIGIQSDVTPLDLFTSTAIEEGLDGISLARMNTDNKWVDAALGVAALGLFAAGVKNARTQQALAKHVSAQKTVDQVIEQMGRDAARFDSLLKGTPSSVGEDVYRTYDQLAERVTRARGYPPSAAEANRWLDKVAPKVTPPTRNPTVVEDVKAFRSDTLRTTGVAATDNDVATYLLKTHPESYTPPKNYIPPKSSAGDAFRSEAAKTMGSQQAQYLDYARRADMEAVKPRIVKDPWQSTKEVISRISNKELHMNAPLAPALRLIKNALRVTHGFIANAGPMTDEQRRAMFAGGGGRGPARGSSSASIGKIKGSTQNFSASYSGPSKLQTYAASSGAAYQPPRPASYADSNFLNLHSSPPPPFTGFTSFTNGYRDFLERYPGETGGDVGQISSLFTRYEADPNAFITNPEALNQLEQIVGRAVQKYRGDPPTAWDPREAHKSHLISHALDILHSQNRLTYYEGLSRTKHPGVTFTSHMPSSGYDPFSKNVSVMPLPKPGSPGSKSPAIQKLYAKPGGSESTLDKTSPVYYRPPNDKGIGYYNPNQPYVPGQPRIDERGNKIYGPKPGEPGFIDIGKWREGANPRGPGIPVSQPYPIRKDTVKKK